MSSKIGYCPWCGSEITPKDYEAHTGNIIWNSCNTYKCKGTRIELKSDNEGFVLEPSWCRGKYLYTRIMAST